MLHGTDYAADRRARRAHTPPSIGGPSWWRRVTAARAERRAAYARALDTSERAARMALWSTLMFSLPLAAAFLALQLPWWLWLCTAGPVVRAIIGVRELRQLAGAFPRPPHSSLDTDPPPAPSFPRPAALVAA